MTFSLLLALSLCAAPTTTELEQLGRDVEADFSAGKDGLSSRVDAETLVARALKGTEVRAEYRRGLVQGVRQGFAPSWAAVARALADGGRLTFKGVVTVDGEAGLRFRVLFKDGAFNFFELAVRKDASGALKVVDVWELTAGSLRSEDLRLVAVPVLGELEQGVLERILGKDQALTRHMADLRKMNEAVRDGRPAEAATVYTTLPKELQEHRLFLRAYIGAVVDTPAYEGAMGRYLALYPTDTAALVMGIDYYFLKKNWPKCLAAISAVEKRAGDDAWFDYLRASAATTQEDWALARKHLVAAIGKEPSLPQPYYSLIDVTLTQKKYAETAKWLDAAEKGAGVTFDIDEKTEGFTAFTASKEGKAWLKGRKK